MSQLGRTLFIVNPYAKSGRGRLAIPSIERTARGVLDFEIAVTQNENHAFELARTVREFDTIVSVGGDGNAHYVANGILAREITERPAFSVLPIGSGNDYARTLGISTDLHKALASLLDGKRCLIDIGRCNDDYFLESASFGIDAEIAKKTIELRKTSSSSGILLYLRAGFDVIGKRFESLRAQCSYDDGPSIEQESLIFSATIGSTYGGGFII
ncbi:MAG: diacylglycerol kinase family lipid kinase, partial [Actinobacteria bacterium]|nr:diacylglycerol kinase family lipid kinase [Actinomycetota bacterium]